MAIDLERADGLARITLDFPERRNALSLEDFAELGRILAEVASSTANRAVILTGTGKSFCAGANIVDSGTVDDGPREPGVVAMRQINQTAKQLFDMPQPCLAAVNGHAYGAGMSLALGCDVIIASDTASFCQVFIKRGLSPDVGSTWLLPRTIGLHAAKRMALLGEPIDAHEAARLGIVSQVVPLEELGEAATQWGQRMAEGPPIAMALTKELLNRSFSSSFADALHYEAAANSVNSGTGDVAEAFAAFSQKRTPTFQGR